MDFNQPLEIQTANQQNNVPNPWFAIVQYKEYRMKPVNKPKQATQTRKTKEDFLRWLRKQEVLKKQAAKDQRNPLKRPAPSRKR